MYIIKKKPSLAEKNHQQSKEFQQSLHHASHTKFPLSTLNLICSLDEFDASSAPKTREVQAYLSLPYQAEAAAAAATAVSDPVAAYSHRFVQRHLAINNNETASISFAPVYDNLRQYCAPKNCDLTVVNLNYYGSALVSSTTSSPSKTSSTAAVAASSASGFNLASNKYFRRAMSRLVLSDLVGSCDPNKRAINSPVQSFMAPNGLFVVSVQRRLLNSIFMQIFILFSKFEFFPI